MSPEVFLKISSDQKLHNYLQNNSHWYKYLNRSKDNFQDFYNAFKAQTRNEKVSKVNNVIETLDTVNSIFKIMN